MLNVDALLHGAAAAAQAEPAGDYGDQRQKHREQLVRLAMQAMRRGLRQDPNHVGLLFLKANALRLTADWEAAENEDRTAVLRRLKPAFDAAFDRLRQATLRLGCDTAIARAVLLSNYGLEDMNALAFSEVRDALSSPIPPSDLGGLRRRTRAMNGRCQGFYCGAAVQALHQAAGFEPDARDGHAEQ